MHDYTLLRPFPDESFSSWLNRQPTTTVSRFDLMQKIGEFHNNERITSLSKDPDFDLPYFAARSLRALFELPPLRLRFFCPESSWIIPHSLSDFACPTCLAMSLKTSGRMVFKKSWRYVGSPICPIHNKLILRYEPGRLDMVQFLSSSRDSLRTRLDTVALSALCTYALPMQQHVLRVERGMLRSSNTHIAQKKNLQKANKFLLEFLLHAGADAGGIATQFITAPKVCNNNRREHGWRMLMAIGALESNSLERTCALIMLGIIVGKLGKSHIRRIHEAVEPAGYAYNWAAFEIGTQCRLTLRPEPSIVRKLTHFTDIFHCRNFDRFVEGYGA